MAVKEESIERESEGRECVSLFSLDWGKDLERTSLAYGGFFSLCITTCGVITVYQTAG